MTDPILQGIGLEKRFVSSRNLLGRPRDTLQAVAGVDIEVAPGETLAVVGESGAGKSTVGRLLLRLAEADRGTVRLAGTDLGSLRTRDLRAARKRMQMIFQDPFSSFDPRMTIGEIVMQPLALHFDLDANATRTEMMDLLDRVGINASQADRYPHELSGGQLQRIAIARALAVEPEVIVCDEPVAALDVSIRAQVINLLDDLQQERGIAYVFISHDLSLVRTFADRVAIMYRGRVVEEGATSQLFAEPRHPYTRTLLDAIPVPDPRHAPGRTTEVGFVQPDSGEGPGNGCDYLPRCRVSIGMCESVDPTLTDGEGRSRVRCHVAQSAGT